MDDEPILKNYTEHLMEVHFDGSVEDYWYQRMLCLKKKEAFMDYLEKNGEEKTIEAILTKTLGPYIEENIRSYQKQLQKRSLKDLERLNTISIEEFLQKKKGERAC